MVAPSFQKMRQLDEPFLSSGKMYVRILNEKTGNERIVRWYTEAEYRKAYPNSSQEAPVAATTITDNSQKIALGFKEGPITIFKGVTEDDEEYFRLSEARYCTWWGWYIPCGLAPLADLPSHITPIALPWDSVGTPKGSLKPEAQVREAVDTLLYDSHGVSEYIGTIGERREFTLTVIKNVPFDSGYGVSHLHTFNDEAGNEYIWSTTAKSWEVGEVKHIKATIVAHQTYQGIKQTKINRCTEI
jgi:hypothetical protein